MIEVICRTHGPNKHQPGVHDLKFFSSFERLYRLELLPKSRNRNQSYLFPSLLDPELTISATFAGMDAPSTFQRKGVSKFMSLPSEIRCMIYYHLVVEPRPLPLSRSSRRDTKDENSLCTYTIPKDLRLLYTCRKAHEEMNDLIYSEICFSYSIRIPEVEEGTEAFRVDLTRIQKLYICVGWLHENESESDEAFGSDEPESALDSPDFAPEVFDFVRFVASLVFGGHQLKYVLIECEPQKELENLGLGLSPLALLRKIRLVHFRAVDAGMYAHLRVLETIMMSDQPMDFSNLKDFL